MNEIIVALIALGGVIISVILSFIINQYQHKIALKKIHSEFSGKLYSKRLETYLEIYELVSQFCRMIDSRVDDKKRISYEELYDFYNKYLIKDSKSGLLFSSCMVKSSYNLRTEVKKILTNHKIEDTFSKNLMYNLRKSFSQVELSLKHELGVFGYESPSIMKDSELTKTYSEIWEQEIVESMNR